MAQRPAARKRSEPKSPLETRAHPLVFDGLNCAVLDAAQMATMRMGRVTAMNRTSVRPGAGLAEALLDLETVWSCAGEMRDVAAIVTSVAGIEAAHQTGRIAIVLGAQDSHMVEGDLRHLAVLKRLGLRILQPTYYEANSLGCGAGVIGTLDTGMTPRGAAWLAEMEAQRLLVDLSHCGHRTTSEFIAAATRPIVCSHANAFAICPSPRNKTDDMVRAIAATGGLVGAVMWAPALSHAARPTLDTYLDHLDHLIDVGGIEHVGFASSVPQGQPEDPEAWERTWGRGGLYRSVTGMCGDWHRFATRHNADYDSLAHTPRIWDGLRRRGYRHREIEKVMSGNWLRVLREVWGE